MEKLGAERRNSEDKRAVGRGPLEVNKSIPLEQCLAQARGFQSIIAKHLLARGSMIRS